MRSVQVNAPRRPGLRARLTMFFLVRALAVGAIVLQVAPDIPKTIAGWVVLIVGGPPVYLGLEWMFGRLFNKETGARISDSRFSFARIFVAPIFALIVLAPIAWLLLRTRVAG
jgi:hypothetical protein